MKKRLISILTLLALCLTLLPMPVGAAATSGTLVKEVNCYLIYH